MIMRNLPILAAAIMCLAMGPLNAQESGLRAQGNEPFWAVTVDGGMLSVHRPDADTLNLPVSDDLTAVALAGHALTIIAAADPARGLRAYLVMSDQICRDTMSGLPYPATAELALNGLLLLGCAGRPEALLSGGTWEVREIVGAPLLDGTQIRLSFDDAGGLSGHAGCNRLFGGYEMTGEGVRIANDIATTRMLCPDGIMAQESAFLTALADIRRFDLDQSGALILIGSDGAASVIARSAGP